MGEFNFFYFHSCCGLCCVSFIFLVLYLAGIFPNAYFLFITALGAGTWTYMFLIIQVFPEDGWEGYI